MNNQEKLLGEELGSCYVTAYATVLCLENLIYDTSAARLERMFSQIKSISDHCDPTRRAALLNRLRVIAEKTALTAIRELQQSGTYYSLCGKDE